MELTQWQEQMEKWEKESKLVADRLQDGAFPEAVVSVEKADGCKNVQHMYKRYQNFVIPMDLLFLFLEPDPSDSHEDYYFLQFNGNHRGITASEVKEGEDMIRHDPNTLNSPVLISTYVVCDNEPQNTEVHSARLIQPVVPDEVTGGENKRVPNDRFACRLDLPSARALFEMVDPRQGQNNTEQEDPQKVWLAALSIMAKLLSKGPGVLYQTMVDNLGIQGGEHLVIDNLSDGAVRKRSKDILCERTNIRVAILDGLQRINGYARLLESTGEASIEATRTPILIIVPGRSGGDARAGSKYITEADIACAQEVSRIQQRGLAKARGVRVLNAMVSLARTTAISLARKPWTSSISGDKYLAKQRRDLAEDFYGLDQIKDDEVGRKWHKLLENKAVDYEKRWKMFADNNPNWHYRLQAASLRKQLSLRCIEVVLSSVRDGASSPQLLHDVLTRHFSYLSGEQSKMDESTLLKACVMLSRHFIDPRKELWMAIVKDEEAKQIHQINPGHFCRWFEYLVQLSIATSMVQVYHDFGLELPAELHLTEMKDYRSLFSMVAGLVEKKRILMSFALQGGGGKKLYTRQGNVYNYDEATTIESFEPRFGLAPNDGGAEAADGKETYTLHQIAAAFSRTTLEATTDSSSGSNHSLRNALTALFSEKVLPSSCDGKEKDDESDHNMEDEKEKEVDESEDEKAEAEDDKNTNMKDEEQNKDNESAAEEVDGQEDKDTTMEGEEEEEDDESEEEDDESEEEEVEEEEEDEDEDESSEEKATPKGGRKRRSFGKAYPPKSGKRHKKAGSKSGLKKKLPMGGGATTRKKSSEPDESGDGSSGDDSSREGGSGDDITEASTGSDPGQRKIKELETQIKNLTLRLEALRGGPGTAPAPTSKPNRMYGAPHTGVAKREMPKLPESLSASIDLFETLQHCEQGRWDSLWQSLGLPEGKDLSKTMPNADWEKAIKMVSPPREDLGGGKETAKVRNTRQTVEIKANKAKKELANLLTQNIK